MDQHSVDNLLGNELTHQQLSYDNLLSLIERHTRYTTMVDS